MASMLSPITGALCPAGYVDTNDGVRRIRCEDDLIEIETKCKNPIKPQVPNQSRMGLIISGFVAPPPDKFPMLRQIEI